MANNVTNHYSLTLGMMYSSDKEEVGLPPEGEIPVSRNDSGRSFDFTRPRWGGDISAIFLNAPSITRGTHGFFFATINKSRTQLSYTNLHPNGTRFVRDEVEIMLGPGQSINLTGRDELRFRGPDKRDLYQIKVHAEEYTQMIDIPDLMDSIREEREQARTEPITPFLGTDMKR